MSHTHAKFVGAPNCQVVVCPFRFAQRVEFGDLLGPMTCVLDIMCIVGAASNDANTPSICKVRVLTTVAVSLNKHVFCFPPPQVPLHAASPPTNYIVAGSFELHTAFMIQAMCIDSDVFAQES